MAGIYAFYIKKMWEIENLIEDKGFHAVKGDNLDINKRRLDFHNATNIWTGGCGLLGFMASFIPICV